MFDSTERLMGCLEYSSEYCLVTDGKQAIDFYYWQWLNYWTEALQEKIILNYKCFSSKLTDCEYIRWLFGVTGGVLGILILCALETIFRPSAAATKLFELTVNVEFFVGTAGLTDGGFGATLGLPYPPGGGPLPPETLSDTRLGTLPVRLWPTPGGIIETGSDALWK